MPRFTPITVCGLIDSITDLVLATPTRLAIAIDGADAAEPISLAQAVADNVRAHGRGCDVVSLHDYVKPASLRLEFGRNDEMSYRTIWFDYDALAREVVDALHNDARWLPALWNEQADRSARTRVRAAAAGDVVLVTGPMLLGRNLAFDSTIRLHLSEAALLRATHTDQLWTVPALLRHEQETAEQPDVDVRWDHRDRPAVRITSRAEPAGDRRADPRR